MKWEQTRQYSQKEIQAMQQDAIERVRQMQQRSEQVLRRSAKMPSFFIEDNSQHHLQNHQNAYKEERKSPSPSIPHIVQESHPSSSFHPTPPNETKPSIEQLLSALNLDKERLLILALLFLLYTDGADQTLLLALLYLFFE